MKFLALAALSSLLPSALAQQVMWKDNPITGKVVGLTYETSDWPTAESQAVAYGGHLVTIRSQAENDWLFQKFSIHWSGSSGGGPWIGLNDVAQEGSFVWASGETAIYRNWSPGQPDNVNDEDWAHFFWQINSSIDPRQWNDLNLSYGSMRSLIEAPRIPPRSWSWPVSYGLQGSPSQPLLADLDGDSDVDVVCPFFGYGQIGVWENNRGLFSLSTILSGSYIDSGLVNIDFDRDGDLDIVCAQGVNPSQLLAFPSSGAFQYGSAQYMLPISSPTRIAKGDFDRDGFDDLVVGSNQGPGYIHILRSQANGTFVYYATIQLMNMTPYRIEVSDVDGDGFLDVVFLGAGGGFSPYAVGVIWGASQAGSYSIDLVEYTNSGLGLAVGDVSRDGSPEIITSNKVILRHVGARQFAPLLASPIVGNEQWESISIGDIDGDLDGDLMVGTAQNSNLIYRNNGAEFVLDNVALDQRLPIFVYSPDLDLDGDADRLSLHIGNGGNFLVSLNQAVLDCDGDGVTDSAEILAGTALDCNGNGRPDECDVVYGVSQDSNGNGILDDCEPTLVSLSPAVRAAFTAGTVAVATTNVPNGVATLTLSSPGFAQPIVRTFAIANNAGSLTLPALTAPSASDVVASGTISFTDALGNTVVTDVTADVFTWDVPRIVAASPGNAPYDQTTAVIFTLADHLASSGFGTARFGSGPNQSAFLTTIAGQRVVSTIAPAQPAPGPVDVLLQFGNEYTLAQRGFVFLGPGVTNLSATSGWQAGGEALDVELYGFAPNVPVDVIFGSGAGAVSVGAVPSGVAAQSFLSLTTPYLPAAGALDFTVVQNAGLPSEKRVVSPGAWLAEAPRIASVSPSSGFQGGGDLVTLSLEGFPAGVATRVELGSQVYNATNSGTLDLSTASLTTTLAPLAGPVDVNVRQGLGGPTPLDATLAAGFTVIAPTFTSVSPSSGPREGGTQVVAQTSGFDATIPAQVQLGGTTLVGTVSGSGPAQTVSFRTTLATPGLSDVTISQGVLTSTLPGAFTFNAPIISNYCQAKLTSASTLPVIGFTGSPSASTGDFAITLSNALPNKNCLYFSNLSPSNLSFNGGKLCVSSSGILRGPTSSTDASSFASVPFPVTPAAIGTNRYFQWWFRDPADPFTVGLSGGLRILGFYP